MQTMRDQIVAIMERLGEWKAFTAKDFLDIASRGTIDMALSGLTREGTMRARLFWDQAVTCRECCSNPA